MLERAVAIRHRFQEQADFLVGHGCAYYQGYLFSPPKPVEQISELFFQSKQPGHFAA